MRIFFVVQCWFALAVLIAAHTDTAFRIHCSTPNATFLYVSSPNARGSLDIIWSCFAVLLACVYSVLHSDVPARAEHFGESLRNSSYITSGRYIWHSRVLHPVLWSLFTLIAPEYVFGLALGQFCNARTQLKQLHKNCPNTRTGWTLSHMFFADSGGFVILYKEPEDCADEIKHHGRATACSLTKLQAEPGNPVSKHGYGAEAGAFNPESHFASDLTQVIIPIDCDTPSLGVKQCPLWPTMNEECQAPEGVASERQTGDYHQATRTESTRSQEYSDPNSIGNQTPDHELFRFHLDAAVYRAAIERGLLSAAAIPTEDLEDRDKSDWFAKALTVVQLASFFVTMLARAVDNLPISPLEVSVSAFAIGSIFTYSLLWSKPKNAFATVTVARYRRVPQELYRLKESNLELCGEASRSAVAAPPSSLNNIGTDDKNVDSQLNIAGSGMIIFALIFCAIHVAAWNLTFPSRADEWLWRSAAVAAIITVPIFSLLLWGAEIYQRTPRILIILISLNGSVYILARVVLIVETIRTLFYLPPGAYLTPGWAIGIPHFS